MIKDEEGTLKINDWVSHLNQEISLYETNKHRLLAWLGSILTILSIMIWILLNLLSDSSLIMKEIVIIGLITISFYLLMQLFFQCIGFDYYILKEIFFRTNKITSQLSYKKVLEYINKKREIIYMPILLNVSMSIFISFILILVLIYWISDFKILLSILIFLRIISITILTIIIAFFLKKLNFVINMYEHIEKIKPFKKGLKIGESINGILMIWYVFQICIILIILAFDLNVAESFQKVWKIVLMSIVIIALYFCTMLLYRLVKIQSKNNVLYDFRDMILIGDISESIEIINAYKQIIIYTNSQDFLLYSLDDIIKEDTVYEK